MGREWEREVGTCVVLRTVMLNSPAPSSQKEAIKEVIGSACCEPPAVGRVATDFVFLIA